MDRKIAVTVFESLASGVRLDIFRLLVAKGPEGIVAGEIATALALPATNASFHLKALTQAGLIRVEQEGRYQRYRANLPLMAQLITYLTQECCSGHPEQCIDLAGISKATAPLRSVKASATDKRKTAQRR